MKPVELKTTTHWILAIRYRGGSQTPQIVRKWRNTPENTSRAAAYVARLKSAGTPVIE
jgi:hypothetical protein